MPQVQLPVFPAGVIAINDSIGAQCRDGKVVYLNGHLPVFSHDEGDLAAFRLFTTQLIVNGTATQGQIVRAFGVPLVTVKRMAKLYRTAGAAAFFKPAEPRSGSKLTLELKPQVQALLDQGLSAPEVSAKTGVLTNTLHKAIRSGRLSARPALQKKVRPARPAPPRANAV